MLPLISCQFKIYESAAAIDSRKAFQAATKSDQDALIEFLKSLQVLPPGTPSLVVDEKFQPKRWGTGVAKAH